MALKKYKPYTPSRRSMTGYSFDEITTNTPYKPLTTGAKKSGGRNNTGRTTIRFRGGGHKKLYREIDRSLSTKLGIPGVVQTIEYDPHRTAYISLVNFADGEKKYVLSWKGNSVGTNIVCSDKETGLFEPGNRRPLKYIPEGLTVFCVELQPSSKGKLVKSAGNFATIVGKDVGQKIVFLKLPSGEVRKFNENCYATIGSVSNEDHKNIVIGKAGRHRWMGIKSFNRGKSMNPVDHPHGGGEGRSGIGLKYPKAFNGRVVAAGIKTRRKKKQSNSMIISRRTKN